MMIARLAGVAEGTLFLYFPTKDVLLSAVFEHLLQDLEAGLGAPAAGVSSRQTAQFLWNRYIDWGAANPDAYSTMNQLLASDRLSAGQLRRVETLYAFPDLHCRRRFAGLTDREALALSDATEKAIADTTVRLAMTRPQHAEAYKMAGFDMLWAAVTRARSPGTQPARPAALIISAAFPTDMRWSRQPRAPRAGNPISHGKTR